MQELRFCPECRLRMKVFGRYRKAERFDVIYIQCPKCGMKRKILIEERVIEEKTGKNLK